MKNDGDKNETASSQSEFERLIKPGKMTYIIIIWIGVVGASLGYSGNIIAAVFAIVILVYELNEDVNRRLISVQRDTISLMEKYIKIRQEA